MRYHYASGVSGNKKKQNHKIALPFLAMFGGLYVLAVVLAPSLPFVDGKSPRATAQKLLSSKPGSDGNRLLIPQLNVDIPVVSENEQLDSATHQKPQQGNPLTGGNFVLSANRFDTGLTPMQTKSMSPFYNLDKLRVGDELFVDWESKRYVYQINKRTITTGERAKLDAPTKDSKLTLYSCDGQCQSSVQAAIEAVPVGVVAWNGSKSYIQSN